MLACDPHARLAFLPCTRNTVQVSTWLLFSSGKGFRPDTYVPTRSWSRLVSNMPRSFGVSNQSRNSALSITHTHSSILTSVGGQLFDLFDSLLSGPSAKKTSHLSSIWSPSTRQKLDTMGFPGFTHSSPVSCPILLSKSSFSRRK